MFQRRTNFHKKNSPQINTHTYIDTYKQTYLHVIKLLVGFFNRISEFISKQDTSFIVLMSKRINW